MFLTVCSPEIIEAMGSLSRTWSRTARETHTPPGSQQALQPRGHVDTVAEDVVRLYDDIAEIDADAECKPALLGTASLRDTSPR